MPPFPASRSARTDLVRPHAWREWGSSGVFTMKLEERPEAHEGGNSGRLAVASRLSDADLLRGVVVLARRERESTVELVAHLAELDAGDSTSARASARSSATARGRSASPSTPPTTASRPPVPVGAFPSILDLLADGSLNLSTVRLLAPHVRPDNFEALVATAKGRSKREVEALVARLAPRPDVAASVRKLPASAQSPGASRPVIGRGATAGAI